MLLKNEISKSLFVKRKNATSLSKHSIGHELNRNLIRCQADFNEKTVGQNVYKYVM